MKTKITTILLSLGLLLGFGVVTAPSAAAVNYYNCYWKYRYYVSGLGSYYEKLCWADYSWWEENWTPYKRDGWVVVGSQFR